MDRSGTLESQVEALGAAVGRLEARVAELEHAAAMTHAAAASPALVIAAAATEAAAPARAYDVTLVGRSLVVLGGAYLLRAATELTVVPDALGVAAGLVYALALLLLSDRAAARGATGSSLFHAATALLIAEPLVDEMVVRFHLVPPAIAAALVIGWYAAAALVAHRRRSAAIAWAVTGATLAAGVVLAAQTANVLPAVYVVAAVAAGSAWLGPRTAQPFLAWPVAVVADLVLLPLIELVLIDRSSHGAVAVLVAAATLFVVFAASALLHAIARGASWFDLAQTSVVFGLAIVQGARLPLPPVARLGYALVLLALAVAAMIATVRQLVPDAARRRDAAFFSSLALALAVTALAVGGGAVGVALGGLVLAAALFAVERRVAGSFAALQAVTALGAAAAAAGLLSHALAALALAPPAAPAPPLAWGTLAAVVAALVFVVREPPVASAQLTRVPRLVLLAVAVAAVAGELAWAALRLTAAPAAPAAAIRTGVLAAVAVALALLSRSARARSAGALVYPVLLAGAAKLLWEDFRVGVAATLFVGLAVYGLALIVAPRLRHRAA